MKIIKPLLIGLLVGTAAFSTTYIIVDETKTLTHQLHSKYDTINESFETLSSAFDNHVAEHLEDDDLDQIYKVIEDNFSTLSSSISDSKNDLVKYFQDEIKTSVDTLNETIIDKTATLNEKIEVVSAEVERLSGKFIDVEQSQQQVKKELEDFRISYEASQVQLGKDITLFKNEIAGIKTKADLTDKEIENIHSSIQKINDDFVVVDEIRQSVKSLENQIKSLVIYLESVSKITINNSYKIDELKINISSLQTSINSFEEKIKSIEDGMKDNSGKIISLSNEVSSLNDKYDELRLSFELNISNINTSINDFKSALTALENTQKINAAAIQNINNDIKNLEERFDKVLESNEVLKLDIQKLFISTKDLYKGLFELQEGFKELQDKYDNVPTMYILNEDYEISFNQLPVIQLPELQKLKSLSLFLKVNSAWNSEVVNVNILNAFYTTEGTFMGNVVLHSGNEYLMRIKFNNESISISGFWSRRGNGSWKSISHGERTQFFVSKLIAIY